MILSVNNISFSYPGNNVFKNASFTVSEGMHAILGQNGSGKSTLLRIILGFLKSEGSVEVDGRSVREMSLSERSSIMAYIPQTASISYGYTVLSTVIMGRTASKSLCYRPNAGDEKDAEEILSYLGIENLSKRPITKISGGERQLVMIARALMQGSKIILSDECSSSLDYSNAITVSQILRTLANRGYVVIHATHNPTDALISSDSFISILNGGIKVYEKDAMDGKILSEIYGTRIFTGIIDTGKHRRNICVPE